MYLFLFRMDCLSSKTIGHNVSAINTLNYFTVLFHTDHLIFNDPFVLNSRFHVVVSSADVESQQLLRSA